MNMPLRDIEAEALLLPPSDRQLLLVRLVESLDAEPAVDSAALSEAWNEEIARRIADMDSGLTESIPYEQVRAELKAMIENHGKQ
jgi:putative addiction module component (TIGR02574 family)